MRQSGGVRPDPITPAGPAAAAPAGRESSLARLPLATHAFFFDVDGTLLPIAPRPADVRADAALLAGLRALRRGAGDALALISGRTIAGLDEVMHPERFAAAGLHGFERRAPGGSYRRHAPPQPHKLAEVRRVMVQLVSGDARLLLEDKHFGLALHYRGAPELQETVLHSLRQIRGLDEAGLRLQPGRMVAEITPAGVSKATALAEFFREAPFSGRRPVYVGDDLTDESAFEWVNSVGGLSIAVAANRPTAARASLPSVGEVRAWLDQLIGSERHGAG